MTGQSLFYMGETDLKHKILAIVEEEGAERASYALKLLQSEGELTIASTGKDPAHGAAGDARVPGRRAGDDLPDDDGGRDRRGASEPLHRADGGRGAGSRRGRSTGCSASGRRSRGCWPGRTADEVLQAPPERAAAAAAAAGGEPLRPAADVPGRPQTRTRRDHVKYLTLIRPIALLHQYQRPMQDGGAPTGRRVDVHRGEPRGHRRRQPPGAPRCWAARSTSCRRRRGGCSCASTSWSRESCEAQQAGREDFRFTRREVREQTGWSDTQLQVHLERLVELEYVLVHRGGRGQSFVYELVYDGEGKDGRPFLTGLIDVEAAADAQYDDNLAGSEGHLAGAVAAAQNGPKTGGWRGERLTLGQYRARRNRPSRPAPETASRDAVAEPRPNFAALR